MMSKRPFIGVLAVIAVLSFSLARAIAQGVTTGGVTGTVTDENGQPVEGAQIQLRSTQTGSNIGTVTRSSGQYTIQGVLPSPAYELIRAAHRVRAVAPAEHHDHARPDPPRRLQDVARGRDARRGEVVGERRHP